MKLSDKLKVARTLKGLSQAAAGKVIGVEQQAVSEWERGGGIKQEHWEAIKEALGVDVKAHYQEMAEVPPPSIHPREQAAYEAMVRKNELAARKKPTGVKFSIQPAGSTLHRAPA